MNNEMQYVSTKLLHPHPDNPRKDLGDVTELADSIKANGVMQNLTAVPRSEGGYTVIIGHRRLAAAKKAGLAEVPCVIVDIPYRDQLATMLLENMQRSDLTVYEQAEGFQMMFDFGESVEAISEKTGLSQTTVRRRLKIAELDKKTLKKVQDRQLSLADFDKLSKIEDLEARNRALAEIGTPNFARAVKTEVDAQTNKKLGARWRAALLAKGLTEIFDDTAFDQDKYRGSTRAWLSFTCIAPEEYQPDEDQEFFRIRDSGTVFRRKVTAQDKDADEKDKLHREEEAEKREKLSEVVKRAFELRLEFVISVTEPQAREHFPVIAEYALRKNWGATYGTGWYNRYNHDNFLGEKDVKTSYDSIASFVKATPYVALLRNTYLALGDDERQGMDYERKYRKDDRLYGIYDFLCRLGYEMSDEEKQLLDGTHEMYAKKE